MATGTIISLPQESSQKNVAGNPAPAILPNRDDMRPTKVETIYFYNVAPQTFNVPRYPNHPRLQFKACKRGEEYAIARGSISHPFEEFREDTNFNRIPVYTNGYREATRMLCPLNPGIDQNFDDPATLHQGGNLNRLGVFWSTHNPPLPEELAAARERLEDTYRKEIERMEAIEAESGIDGARAAANRTSHNAADYFEQSFAWHRSDLTQKKSAGKIDCDACGEKIRATAKLCIHCGAPTDPKLQKAWLAERLGGAAPAGRRKLTIDPEQVVDFKS